MNEPKLRWARREREVFGLTFDAYCLRYQADKSLNVQRKYYVGFMSQAILAGQRLPVDVLLSVVKAGCSSRVKARIRMLLTDPSFHISKESKMAIAKMLKPSGLLCGKNEDETQFSDR